MELSAKIVKNYLSSFMDDGPFMILFELGKKVKTFQNWKYSARRLEVSLWTMITLPGCFNVQVALVIHGFLICEFAYSRSINVDQISISICEF